MIRLGNFPLLVVRAGAPPVRLRAPPAGGGCVPSEKKSTVVQAFCTIFLRAATPRPYTLINN